MAQSFWDTYERPESNFLTREQREALVRDHVKVQIVKITEGEGRYGPNWTYTLRIPGYERDMRMSMTKNEARDNFSELARIYLDSGGEVIDAVLTQFRTNSGQYAYAFEQEGHEGEQLSFPDDDVDDIPF